VRASDIGGSIAAAVGTPDAEIRLLRGDEHGERDALVALLDGWEAPDGWRGRAGDFFRRYLDRDPTFEARNVVVAECDGRLAGCVQIFPRTLRARAGGAADGALVAVPVGGIGSVFTRPEARGGGIASAMLERALAELRRRGLELSLLFASRHAFYARLGWQLVPRARALWLRDDDTAAPAAALRIVHFDPARDLDAAFALHAAHSGALAGTFVRDAAFFRAQLGFAGNPDEDFLLARDERGQLLAYARAAVLEGIPLVTELARRPEPAAAEALADLVLALLQPREPDPLAPPGRPSTELRRRLVAPCLADAALDDALMRRRLERKDFSSRDAMLRVVDAEALARRTAVPRAPGDDDAAWLARAFPPEQLVLWPADRF
jgi:GNAT superfamily N-acetyltransferase